MYFSAKSAAFLCLCFLAAPPAFGQDGHSCLQRTVIANVVDDRGITPADLTRENFKITYKGQTANPLNVAYTKGPRRVMVLLDVSGSMSSQGTGKWEVARAAAWELVASLPPGSRAGLMTFSEKTEIRAAMSLDRKPIQDWLDGEYARRAESLHGHTALYAAIQSAIQQLQPAEPGDAIYVLSDGGENASHLSKSKVEDALASSGTRLFALLVPSGGFVTQEEQLGIEDLLQATADSGGFSKALDLGQVAFPSVARVSNDDPTREKVKRHTQQFALEIAAFYSVTVQLPEDPSKPQHLEIAVVDSQGHKRKDLFVAYPHRVSPCGAESVRR